MKIQPYFGFLFANGTKRHKQTAASRFVLIIGIGNKHIVVSYQPAIPVNTSKISKIQHILWLSGRINRIVTIISPHGNYIVFSSFQMGSNIGYYRQISTKMLFDQCAVDPHFRFSHNRFEVQKQAFSGPTFFRCEMLAVPNTTLIVDTSASFSG